MAGAQKQLPRQPSVESDAVDTGGATAAHSAASVQGTRVPLRIAPKTNLFGVYSGAGLAPIDNAGRVIPSLSTEPRRPAAHAPPPPQQASAVEQFHDAMNFYSLFPFPVGAAFSLLDGAVYGAESLTDGVKGNYGQAGLGALGAGAGVAGVLGPEARMPAKAAHVAAEQVLRARGLAAGALDVHSRLARSFLIGELGEIARKDGPGADIAVQTLQEIALRRASATPHSGADDYHNAVFEAAEMLVKADTKEANAAVEKLLLESHGSEVRIHVINALGTHSPNAAPILRRCVLDCPNTWIKNYAVDALVGRASSFDDEASDVLRELLHQAPFAQRLEILRIGPSMVSLLETGLGKFQPPEVRIAAAHGMVDSLLYRSAGRLDTASLRTDLLRFRHEVASDPIYSAVVLAIDRAFEPKP